MAFIIAKYAAPEYIEENWLDGKDHVFSVEDSMFNTYTGKELGVPQLIATFSEAAEWLQKCRELNPSVGYAICTIGEEGPQGYNPLPQDGCRCSLQDGSCPYHSN